MIKEARKKIDAIDSKILKLLNRRAKFAKDVGSEKIKRGLPIYIPEREAEILDHLKKENKGPLKDFSIESIYSEIISACRILEKPLTVAFLGPETTFTHIAATKAFGASTKYIPERFIGDIFEAVEKHQADLGVVPVENSMEGTVVNTLDLLVDSELSIVSEKYLEVRHNLLSKYALNEITKIYSHPMAIAQCRKWISSNLPNAEIITVSSTAKAAESASLYISSAAIASKPAGRKYNLNVLASNIHDSRKNFTRFLVVGKNAPKKTGKDKTSIAFSVKHKAGALFDSLKPFSKHNLNLTKIESRPAKSKLWEYVFFVDIEGYLEDAKIKKALAELEKHCSFLKILGSYPEGIKM